MSAPERPLHAGLFDLGGVLVEFTGPVTLLRRLGDRLGAGLGLPVDRGQFLAGELEPAPEVFAHVAASLACEAGEILFLDDQPLIEAGALS